MVLYSGVLNLNDRLHILQLKVGDIYKCQLLKFIFKLIHKQLPHYFKQFAIKFRNQQHNYATRTCTTHVNHEFAKRSIRFNAPAAYNSSNLNIIEKIYSHSFNGFCIYVKYQLIDSYNNTCSISNCFSCRGPIQ